MVRLNLTDSGLLNLTNFLLQNYFISEIVLDDRRQETYFHSCTRIQSCR